MRKSIASRFFSVMSMVLVFSIGTLGIFFVFFANRYFQTDRLNLLNLCVTNAQAAFSDSLQEKDGITTEAQRSELRENLRLISNTTSTIVILADENGKCIVCTQEDECTHEGAFLPNETMKALGSVSATMKLGKIFEDIYSQTSQLSVGRAARDSKGNIIGYVLAFSDATNITIFSNAIISIFMVCAGTMLTISSVVSIIVTSHLTTPLRNISDAARRFSRGILAPG